MSWRVNGRARVGGKGGGLGDGERNLKEQKNSEMLQREILQSKNGGVR